MLIEIHKYRIIKSWWIVGELHAQCKHQKLCDQIFFESEFPKRNKINIYLIVNYLVIGDTDDEGHLYE